MEDPNTKREEKSSSAGPEQGRSSPLKSSRGALNSSTASVNSNGSNKRLKPNISVNTGPDNTSGPMSQPTGPPNYPPYPQSGHNPQPPQTHYQHYPQNPHMQHSPPPPHMGPQQYQMQQPQQMHMWQQQQQQPPYGSQQPWQHQQRHQHMGIFRQSQQQQGLNASPPGGSPYTPDRAGPNPGWYQQQPPPLPPNPNGGPPPPPPTPGSGVNVSSGPNKQQLSSSSTQRSKTNTSSKPEASSSPSSSSRPSPSPQHPPQQPNHSQWHSQQHGQHWQPQQHWNPNQPHPPPMMMTHHPHQGPPPPHPMGPGGPIPHPPQPPHMMMGPHGQQSGPPMGGMMPQHMMPGQQRPPPPHPVHLPPPNAPVGPHGHHKMWSSGGSSGPPPPPPDGASMSNGARPHPYGNPQMPMNSLPGDMMCKPMMDDGINLDGSSVCGTTASEIQRKEKEARDKGRGSYRCGRCGVPKKGHICPYQPKVKRRPDEPPPDMKNASTQVEMDEYMILRRLNLEIQGFPESYASEPHMSEDRVGTEPHPPPPRSTGSIHDMGGPGAPPLSVTTPSTVSIGVGMDSRPGGSSIASVGVGPTATDAGMMTDMERPKPTRC